ncbi:hypothetical protein GBF38_017460, partial [Nibea albiflora]
AGKRQREDCQDGGQSHHALSFTTALDIMETTSMFYTVCGLN